MQIRKRSGALEDYAPGKITAAMSRAFASVGETPDEEALAELVAAVEQSLGNGEAAVEEIQDQVERVLMARGCFAAAKSYILYRQKRTELRAARREIVRQLGDETLEPCLAEIQREFDQGLYSMTTLASQFVGFVKPSMDREELLAALTKAAVELTSPEAPAWEIVAARFLNHGFRRQLAARLERLGIGSFYEKLVYLVREGLYGEYILQAYSRGELEEAAAFLDDSRDRRFTWSGLDLLLKRYVIQNRRHEPLETPQEMFFGDLPSPGHERDPRPAGVGAQVL